MEAGTQAVCLGNVEGLRCGQGRAAHDGSASFLNVPAPGT